jgi:hypothetical protein
MELVPHTEVHPVDPSKFGDMRPQLRAVALLSPYTVSSFQYCWDIRVRPQPDFFGNYEILDRDSTLEDFCPFLPTKIFDQTKVLMAEQHSTHQIHKKNRDVL